MGFDNLEMCPYILALQNYEARHCRIPKEI